MRSARLLIHEFDVLWNADVCHLQGLHVCFAQFNPTYESVDEIGKQTAWIQSEPLFAVIKRLHRLRFFALVV